MTVDLAVSPGGRPADASPIGTPGGRKNWVDQAGGLPRYIRMIAHALIRKGMTPSHAIATAVNRVRKLAAGSTNPKVKAAAMAAVAEWEAKKAKSHVSLAYADDPDALWVDLATLEDADAMLLLDLAPGNYRPPYDWKHGYIPITPAAALSKAKGNKKRASKLLRGGVKPSPRMAKQLEGARKSAPRVAKAQDDENRGRGVPGELAAAKKTAAPKPDKSPAAATLEAAKADRARMAAGAERRKAETPITPAVVADMNAHLDWRSDGTVATSGRGGRLDKAVQHGLVELKTSGPSIAHDDHYVVTPKGRAAGLGKPVSSGGGSVSAPKGASPGEGDGSPRLSGDTVRRMSDDQLDNALSRLMAAGGKDSHALSLIEKEMDRRESATRAKNTGDTAEHARLAAELGLPPGRASQYSLADLRKKVKAAKRGGSPKGDTPGAGDTGSKVASLEAQAAKASAVPGGSGDPVHAATGIVNNHRLRVVERGYDRSNRRYEVTAPGGDHRIFTDRAEALAFIDGKPAAPDTALDDLTFKADRQSHKFTDDVVSRMSQPQLERSLGTLLGAGYDNDAPAVAKLTAALEAKDPEAAKVYRKGADRTAQDAKAALRFAHGTREQQKADYHAYVEHLAHQAEASDMVGAHALSRASRNTTVRLPDLWSMTPAQIRKHASPELLEWFSKPGNEPLPFDAWRAAHLGATDRRAVESLRRRREQWLSEYG